MTTNSDQEPTVYGINYDTLLNSSGLASLTVALCNNIRQQQYMTTGQFLGGLHDADLTALVKWCEDALKSEDDNTEIIYNMSAIAMCLTAAEGGDVDAMTANPDIFLQVCNQFIMCVVVESLRRKNLVKFNLSEVSLDPDANFLIKRVDVS